MLGAALRLWRLDAQSFWIDELYSWRVARPDQSLATFGRLVLHDVHPPLYYFLLRSWLGVAGESIFAARLPSAVAGILTLAAAIVLYRPLLPPARQVAFVLLLAVSYGGVYFAQEARSYALLLLLAVVMTAAALRLALLRASGDDQAWDRALGLLTATAVVAGYTHYFGVVLAVATLGAVVVSGAGTPRRRARSIAAVLVVAAALAPWLAVHLPHLGDRAAGLWIGQGQGWYAWNLAWFAKLGFGHPVAIVLLLAGGAVALRPRHFDTGVWLPALVCLLGGTFLGLVDAHTTMTTGRNLIVFLPALYLVAAAVIVAVAEGLAPWTGVLGALVYALAVAGACAEPLPWYFTAVHKAQWRESAAAVLTDTRCRGAVIFVYDEAKYYRYFVRRAGARLTLVPIARTQENVAADPRVGRGACPVILWAAELERDELDGVLGRMQLDVDSVDVVAFHDAFVVRALGLGMVPPR